MLSLHNITHAVMIAVLATLVRKYLQLKFQYEDLELAVQLCGSSGPEMLDNDLHDSADLDNGKESLSESELNHMDHRIDEPSGSVGDKGVQHSRESSIASVLSTSVWCYGKNRSEKFCHFHNLCYFSEHKDFVFVHGEDSVMEGLYEGNFSMLDLSSVEGHNKFFFSFVNVLSEQFRNVTVQWVNETSLVFSRFKPDNLMHVLHDDILPLHHTVKWIMFLTWQMTSSLDVQFVFMDDWEESEFDSFYETLTEHPPIHKLDLDNAGQVVCFSNSFVGISKTTTWYQYGFVEPQGPKLHTEVTSKHIHDTIQHLLQHLPSEVNTDDYGQYLVLLSRKQNRLILNEGELIIAIARESKMKVLSISFETHTIHDMIHIARGSRGIIGMHGSLMSLSLFLQPGSIIIELFPFAVNPSNYTPYRSLAMIKGMDLVYKAWANPMKENTIAHPEYVPEFGGIHHLPKLEQDIIKSQTDVPTHLCCSDPSWLFHIYQDTIVAVQEIAAIVKTAIEESSSISNWTPSMMDKAGLFPGPVNNAACERIVSERRLTLKLTWEQPWNVPYIKFDSLNYEVWLQNVNKDDEIVSFLLSNKTTHILSRSIEPDFTYHIWVRCLIDGHVNGEFRSVLDC